MVYMPKISELVVKAPALRSQQRAVGRCSKTNLQRARLGPSEKALIPRATGASIQVRVCRYLVHLQARRRPINSAAVLAALSRRVYLGHVECAPRCKDYFRVVFFFSPLLPFRLSFYRVRNSPWVSPVCY